ncbi:MAG TPA: hypothetical protein VG433_08665, partial [Pirellulales bacterium]|nr:hypothetical protein [Pirellulales bacterium]
ASGSTASGGSQLQAVYNAVSQTLQANGINIDQSAGSQGSTAQTPGSAAVLTSMLSALMGSSENQSIAESLLGGLSSSDTSSSDAGSLMQLLQNVPSGTGLNLTG